MGKQSAWVAIQKKRWPLLILALLSLFTAMLFFAGTSFDSCATNSTSSTKSNSIVINNNHFGEEEKDKFTNTQIHSKAAPNPLDFFFFFFFFLGLNNPLEFMKSKLVLLVSHELSLSGNIVIFHLVLRKIKLLFLILNFFEFFFFVQQEGRCC